jgi:hypothetical protein
MAARFGLIWFSGFRGKDLNVIFYQNMSNLHNWYKSAERKISQKNKSFPLKPLNQIKPNLAGMVLGWIPFKIMSDSPVRAVGHILKGTHTRTIPARFLF